MTVQVEGGVYSGYRWVMLVLLTLVNFLTSFCQYLPAYFAQDIMADFAIGTSGFAVLVSSPMIFGFALAFISGTLADRFGIKRVVLVGLVISACGAMLRAFSHDFTLLLVSSIMFGIAAAFATSNLAKFVMAWFPARQISLAIGIGTAMGTGGIAVAQAITGIVFPDYGVAFLTAGILMVCMLVAWIVLAREKKIEARKTSMGEGLKAVVKSRGVWMAGVGALLYQGVSVATGSFLITALVVYWQTDPVMAGIITALYVASAAIGSAVVPPIISRFAAAKPICMAISVVAAVLLYCGWIAPGVAAKCIVFVLAGLSFGGLLAIFLSYPSILSEVNDENSGAAGGLITTVMMFGSIVLPSTVVTGIAGEDYNMMIIICCVMVLLCAVVFALLPSIYRGSIHKDGEL